MYLHQTVIAEKVENDNSEETKNLVTVEVNGQTYLVSKKKNLTRK